MPCDDGNGCAERHALIAYPRSMKTSGCDLSHHNATPASFAAWGFAFLRVSYGLTVDESAERHAARARATNPGIILGAYHYLEGQDGAAQADLLLTREAILGGEMMLGVDVEDLPGHEPWPRVRYAHLLLDFARRVRASSRVLFVYGSFAFLQELFEAAPMTMREVAAITLLWLADWTAPYPPAQPWERVAILQDHGAKPGGIDHDVFAGSPDELRELAGLTELHSREAKHALLKRDSAGPEVRELQRDLNRWGAALQVDGLFGPKTDAAVRRFQGDHDLKVDGIVGPATWALLLHAPAPVV